MMACRGHRCIQRGSALESPVSRWELWGIWCMLLCMSVHKGLQNEHLGYQVHMESTRKGHCTCSCNRAQRRANHKVEHTQCGHCASGQPLNLTKVSRHMVRITSSCPGPLKAAQSSVMQTDNHLHISPSSLTFRAHTVATRPKLSRAMIGTEPAPGGR
jgi:hypothetical protein